MAKRQLTRTELEGHLEEQLDFLVMSAASFDSGFLGEAKRLAATLRVLLHQTARSHSLLGQLGMRQRPFYTSCYQIELDDPSPHFGLVYMTLGSTIRYEAKLDSQFRPDSTIPFSKWWETETVLQDASGHRFDRRQLVLFLANKDGGAHVDPELDESFGRLKSRNGMGFLSVNLDSGIQNSITDIELHSVRQIAHEALRTLRQDYPRQELSSTF